MKILLVRPPANYIKGSIKPSASLPIGLLSIAAVLEKQGCNVEVFDAQVNVRIPLIQDAAGNLHMGYPWKDVDAEIRKRKPDLVGITCPFTTQRDNAIRTAEIAKEIDPGIVTVIGGNHATARPHDFFTRTKAVDVVCRGEGEYAMLDIVAAVSERRGLAGIPGTAVKDGDTFIVSQDRPYILDLDRLPFPAYHLVNMEDYFLLSRGGFTDRPLRSSHGADRAVSVITSRGCPFNCVFCSIHLHMGRLWRAHSVEYVLEHLDLLVSGYGIRHVHFEDDNISANTKRFENMLDGFLRKGNRFTWDTPNGVRVDTLSKEILAACKRTGCVYLVFGVESGSQRVLSRVIDKKLDLSVVTGIASACKEVSLDVMSFFVIGFPGETAREMDETVDFALQLQREYDVNPGLFVATPLPGTRLEKIYADKGLFPGEPSPEDLSKMTQGAWVLGTDTFHADDVRASRARFFRGYTRNIIRNLIFFLVRNPLAIPPFAKEVISGSRVRSFAESLLNAYIMKNFLRRSRCQ